MSRRPGHKDAKIEVGQQDQVVDLHGDDGLTDIKRYGQWKDSKDGRYLIPGFLSGSDYSGSMVERSNRDVFMETFSDGEDKWWTHVGGGHGTFAVVIDLKGVPADVEEDVAGFLNGLHEYPLADEDAHSHMEMEAQDEAWKDWGRRDFKKNLEKKFDVELDDVEDSKIDELFEAARDSANVYWINEQGDSMYIDMERIVAKVTAKDAREYLGISILPFDR